MNDRQPPLGEPVDGVGNGQLEIPAVAEAALGAKGEPPRWRVQDGLFGLIVALAGTFVASGAVGALFIAGGVDDLDKSAGFNFTATLLQEIIFVMTAIAFATLSGGVTAERFGLRRFRPSAIGWVVIAFAAYLVISGIYAALVHPPRDELPRSLGADDGVGLAIATGILVVGIAPFVEEFFFRGFLFAALRNGTGVWGAALLSGAIFGAIHLKPQFFVPLTVLGVALAVLYQRTGSIWPCVVMHAANNALAFAVLT